MEDFIIVTMNDIPGYEVIKVHGEVFGLITRSRNMFSNIGAGLRTIFGGEVRGYTRLLVDSRQHAIDCMVDVAKEKGANAIIAMRFDANELRGVMAEIAAYGTAVTIRKQK